MDSLPVDPQRPWPRAALDLAARNIADRIGRPPAGAALILYAAAKGVVAERVRSEMAQRGIETRMLRLGSPCERGHDRLIEWVQSVRGEWGIALLLQPAQAQLLFALVGRPDEGLIGAQTHLFSDWLIPPDGLVRTVGIDMAELRAFRHRLIEALTGARQLRLCTAQGTDLVLWPRAWTATDGEVYTAPIEASVHGVVVFDGSAYSGPLDPPMTLHIDTGRVIDLESIAPTTPQMRMVLQDLGRDAGARCVAELGLGINLGARWDADIMEAEQTRGTCHLGFGRNTPFGGCNESATHTDFCILRPTIEVDGVRICEQGVFSLLPTDRRS